MNTQNKFVVACFLLFLLATVSCNNQKPELVTESKVTFDLVVAKTEIEEANRNFMQSFSKGDSVGLANCYTTDAKALVPNIPAIEGRNNIQHIFAGFIKSGVQKKC